MYVQECSPAVYRPLKELRGFAKQKIKAGESKSVSISLTNRAFAYYSVAEDGWRVNDGAYKILVGDSSQNILLCKTIIIENGEIRF